MKLNHVNLTVIKRCLKKCDKEMPKVGSSYICLAVILTGFVLKNDGNYYPEVFLKECKYIEKEKTVIQYITDDL